ncbi:MAG: DUF927 domain-containing protein [Clostridia bacterium]|nr:DUF927 domain-containing protein [Clostridia bacterium]
MGYLKPNKNKDAFNFQMPNSVEHNVCPYFEMVGFIRNVNAKKENDTKVKIEYNDHGKKGEVILNCGDISNCRNIIELLSRQKLFIHVCRDVTVSNLLTDQARKLNLDPTKTELHHTKLGWHTIDGNECFLYDNETLIDGQPSICDREFDFTAGKKEVYEKLLTDIVFPRKELTLAYILGFSAVVVSRLDKLKIAELGTVVVNVNGKSSTGKSTMEQLMISPFGNPAFSKYGLGLTHSGTLNGILDALEGIHGLPRVIDDLQQNSAINLTELLYTISQQETKMRCGEKWNQNTDGWSGLLVASSETPLMGMMKVQQGTYPRLLNLTNVQWTSTAEEAETIKKVITQNYGFTGRAFIDYVAKIPVDKLAEAYQRALEKVKPMMTERDGLTDRIATRIAAIALTCNLVKHCFKGAFSWTMEQLIEPLIESEQETVQERNPAEKLLEIITTYVVEHKYQNFETEEETRGNGGEPMRRPATQAKHGTIEISLTGEWKVSIHETTMKRILKNEGFNEWGSASKTLIERGILIGTEEKKSNGKTTMRTRRKVGGVNCNVFKLKMEETTIAEDTADEKQETVNEAPQIVAEPLVDTTVWNDQTLEEIFEMDGEANA